MPKSKKRKGAQSHHAKSIPAIANQPWLTQPNATGPVNHAQKSGGTPTKNFQRRGA